MNVHRKGVVEVGALFAIALFVNPATAFDREFQSCFQRTERQRWVSPVIVRMDFCRWVARTKTQQWPKHTR